ncbi:MAG: hypothetical protein V1662_01275 [Candidatus Omnitrophota bacterium]
MGSVLLGLLYDRSLSFVIAAIISIECAALGIFFLMKKDISSALTKT